MTARHLCVALCVSLSFAAPVLAQEPLDPSENARFRWGPIRFTPTLEITSLGRDSNVFNEAVDPKSDFTAAIGPVVNVWIRPARTRLSLTTGGQYLYFKKYDDQRAWNTNNELKWEVPLARLTPFVAGSLINSRARQGYEIDARVRRRDRSYTVGSTLRLSGKTELAGSYRQSELEYDEQETLLGVDLANALNRRATQSAFQFRYALTPLTTFVTSVETGRDRFASANLRDSNSVKVLPGFELKPLALISGTVFVGYRQFDPLNDRLPEYRGVVAAVKAKYTYAATRFEINIDRDLAYSFEETQPYYALLDYGLTITQRITRRWEVVGQGGMQRLAYRSITPAASPVGLPSDLPSTPHDRVDRGQTYGAGIGYRLNETTRLGLNAAHTMRESSAQLRGFEGTRIFGSITYGMQQ
jgi:hypothetical protein